MFKSKNSVTMNAVSKSREHCLSAGLHLLTLALWLALVAMCSSAFGQTVTTTSLALTSAGSTATSVSAGSLITLTASVAAGSTAVQRGQVNFCDATAMYCEDTHLLGTAQLNTSGKAVLQLRLGPGSYSFKAEFLATPNSAVPYAASSSSASALNVTGLYPTFTTIAQSGSSGDYTLSTSVFGFAKSSSMASPTGKLSFLDTSTSNSVLATVALASAGSGPFFVNVSNPAAGNGPGFVVSGDFNRDGNLDLAVGLNNSTNPVAILLGDGTGNLTPVTSNPITAIGNPLLVADFNGDGIPDLLLSDSGSITFTLLLGNGDGTFTLGSGSPFPANSGTLPVVSADFNGDGIPDFVAAGGYYLTVMLGNGDGTFTQVPTTSSTITQAELFYSMTVADYNGDGILDLAVIDLADENLFILLGNGDGTFRQGSSMAVNTISAGSGVTLCTGDFNGDGKPDLAVPIYGSSGSIAVFLGNGDGTFQPASGSPFAAGQWPNRIAVGDFNGDGIADLLVGASTNGSNIFVFLGKGDGTFVSTSTGSNVLPCCLNTSLGDFNGDGITDFVSSSSYDGTVAVSLTALKQSTATANGIAVTGAQSPQNVVAAYPGDSSYASSESTSTPLLVQAASPVFSPPAAAILPTQSIALTSTSPGVSIYYQATGVVQTNGFVPYVNPISMGNVGSVTIQAYATGGNYGQSATTIATYTVILGNPVPALSSLSPSFVTAGGPMITLTINGSGFSPGSTAYWGSTGLPTQLISANKITAQVTAAQTATSGITQITVQVPSPGGGTSNVLQFELDSGGSGTSPTFTTSSGTVAAGATANYPVTLPSTATNITVSCLNLPSGATCSYAPGNLTVSTSATTSSGTYQITVVFNETLPGSAPAIAFLPLLLLPLAFAGKKRRELKFWALGLTLSLSAFALIGCGGGGSSGTSGGGTVQTHQVTSSGVVTLTVN